jgi:CheY-like chemotaxis protein
VTHQTVLKGVQKAQEVNPSLMVFDLVMPVMNGLEAARALKILMPDVPLLMFLPQELFIENSPFVNEDETSGK